MRPCGYGRVQTVQRFMVAALTPPTVGWGIQEVLEGLTFLLFKRCVSTFLVQPFISTLMSQSPCLLKAQILYLLAKMKIVFTGFPGRQYHSLANPFHLQISAS